MECNSPGRPSLMSGWRPWVPNSWVLCVVLLLAVGQCVVCNDSGCDWDGSGLGSSDASSSRSSSQRWLKSRSVVPVYLRCDQGRVTWKYPRGALRVLLRLGGTGNGGARDFRACVKIDANSTGAAVHLEGHRKLIPIHKGRSAPRVADDGEVRRCFTSYKGQVALFLEATPETNHLLSRDTFRLWYHLTPVMSQRDLDDELAGVSCVVLGCGGGCSSCGWGTAGAGGECTGVAGLRRCQDGAVVALCAGFETAGKVPR
ncbi:hypothetical protein MRX96_049832 [Rhipicephalus microplus]